MSAVILSTDELRAVSHLAGAMALAPDPGWAADDLPVADIVATRCLLARGLLQLTPEPALAPRLATMLSQTLPIQPGPTVTVRRDTATGTGRSTLVGTLLAEERSPDIWHLHAADRHELVDRLTGAVPEDRVATAPIRLPVAALSAAERVAADAPEGAVVEHLRSGGLGLADARTIARVLAHQPATTTVQVSHQAGTRTTKATLTWLETAAEAWLVTPETTTGPDDPPSSDLTARLPLPDELDEVLRLEPVAWADLHTALTDLLAELEAPR